MIIVIGIGGAIGAVLRYLASHHFAGLLGTSFPWGTLVINLFGSFLLGILYGLSINFPLDPHIKGFIGTGLLGAFTTFSTFSIENLIMLRDGNYLAMMSYLAGTILGGIACGFLGIVMGSLFPG